MKVEGKSALWLKPITEVAARAGIPEESLLPYGRFMAKIDPALIKGLEDRPSGKLVLVTAMSPTPAEKARRPLRSALRSH